MVWKVRPTDVLEVSCFQSGMFWSRSVQFVFVRRSKGSLWVLTLHLNCRFPIGHHVVQNALIQEQRSWFWTLFEVLVRVWPMLTLLIWMFGTGGANLEPRFKVKRQKRQTFHCRRLRKYKNTTKWVFPVCFSSYKTVWKCDCALRTFHWNPDR